MEFLRLFWNESRQGALQLAVVTLFAGAVNALLIAVIIFAAKIAAASPPGKGDGVAIVYHPDLRFYSLLFFALSLGAFVASRHYITRRSASIAEEIAAKIRLRIVDELRRASLLNFERVDRYDIDDALAKGTAVISGAAPGVASAFSSAVMLLCSTAYIAYISRVAFVLTVVGIGVVVGVFRWNYESFWRELLHSAQLEKTLFRFIDHLRNGFKQVKLHAGRHRDLYEGYIVPSSSEAKEARRRYAHHFAGLTVLGQASLYGLLAAVVFLVPVYSPAEAGKVVQLAAVILFIIGPLNEVIGTVPQMLQTNAAVRGLAALEERLRSAAGAAEQLSEFSSAPATRFDRIELGKITFAYDKKSRTDFELNVPEFTLRAGKLVLLIGGNGSGKSTFLKILTGLYEPGGGEMFVTWPLSPGSPSFTEVVDATNLQRFRSLFSTVFVDFHLFDRLYGLAPETYPLVITLLRRMELGHLVALDATGRFVNPTRGYIGDEVLQPLSTGQKKRLALVVALAEQRPILVLDEFAADQDPVFRERFYLEFLKELRTTHTILAVTHDEHYFERIEPDEIWEMGLDRKLKRLDSTAA